MRNRKKEKKIMVTPKVHNHNHKYDTRSKRNCYLCSSTRGSIDETEHDIQNRDPLNCANTQNTCPKRLVGRESVRNKRLVACAHSSGLPDDLIFSILLLFPAKLLHENMRFVSRVWRQTITSPSFITNHLQISSAHHTHGLLVDHPEQQNLALYIKPRTSDANNPEFQVTELAKPAFNSRNRGSYHGLVLLQDELNIDQFHVANLVTKSIVSLPSFPLLANPSPENMDFIWTGVAFSYASSINRYKVVIGIHRHFRKLLNNSLPQVWVCTVGVDQNWRKLELQGIDKLRRTSRRIPFHTPRSVGGFVYWTSSTFPHGCALDVDTERFYRFRMFPRPDTIPQLHNPTYEIICLQTGLGLVISYKLRFFGRYELWELYELSDLKSSKWTKIIDIDVSVIISQIEKYYQSKDFRSLIPFVYTNDGKLLFLSCYSSIDVFYYHPTEENIKRVPVKRIDRKRFISAYHHVNTLKNC